MSSTPSTSLPLDSTHIYHVLATELATVNDRLLCEPDSLQSEDLQNLSASHLQMCTQYEELTTSDIAQEALQCLSVYLDEIQQRLLCISQKKRFFLPLTNSKEFPVLEKCVKYMQSHFAPLLTAENIPDRRKCAHLLVFASPLVRRVIHWLNTVRPSQTAPERTTLVQFLCAEGDLQVKLLQQSPSNPDTFQSLLSRYRWFIDAYPRITAQPKKHIEWTENFENTIQHELKKFITLEQEKEKASQPQRLHQENPCRQEFALKKATLLSNLQKREKSERETEPDGLTAEQRVELIQKFATEFDRQILDNGTVLDTKKLTNTSIYDWDLSEKEKEILRNTIEAYEPSFALSLPSQEMQKQFDTVVSKSPLLSRAFPIPSLKALNNMSGEDLHALVQSARINTNSVLEKAGDPALAHATEDLAQSDFLIQEPLQSAQDIRSLLKPEEKTSPDSFVNRLFTHIFWLHRNLGIISQIPPTPDKIIAYGKQAYCGVFTKEQSQKNVTAEQKTEATQRLRVNILLQGLSLFITNNDVPNTQKCLAELKPIRLNVRAPLNGDLSALLTQRTSTPQEAPSKKRKHSEAFAVDSMFNKENILHAIQELQEELNTYYHTHTPSSKK